MNLVIEPRNELNPFAVSQAGLYTWNLGSQLLSAQNHCSMWTSLYALTYLFLQVIWDL